MAAVNAVLQDWAIDHEHDVLRFSAGVVQRMIAVLNRTDASLSAQLAQALLQMDRDSFTVERLESLLASVKRLNGKAYDDVLTALLPELKGFTRIEVSAQVAGLSAAVPASVQLHFPIAGLSFEQVYATAMARPFQGRLLKDWAANLEASRMSLIRSAVREGFVQGRTTSEIIKQIRGTREARYADGVLNRPRRELATVVQTALSHTAQTARQAMTDANADLVKATQWLATLDNKTSPMCRIRDGKRYTPDTHKPIGHSIPWLQGPGRLHFNCRSVSVPVLKSWRELGIDIDDMTPATRASMDGAVPADTTYAEWFAKQSAPRQEEILGPQRYQLFRSGKVGFDRFYDDKGRWLSLDQLEKRAIKS